MRWVSRSKKGAVCTYVAQCTGLLLQALQLLEIVISCQHAAHAAYTIVPYELTRVCKIIAFLQGHAKITSQIKIIAFEQMLLHRFCKSDPNHVASHPCIDGSSHDASCPMGFALLSSFV